MRAQQMQLSPDTSTGGDGQEDAGLLVLEDARAGRGRRRSGAVRPMPVVKAPVRPAAVPARGQGALFAAVDIPGGAEAVAAAAVTRWRRCRDCGRPLRAEEAQRAGIGPACAAKRGRAVAASQALARRTRVLRALSVV